MLKTNIEFKTGRQFIARLLPGKDLIETLKDFCKEKNIKAAYIPMLIGAVESIDLIHPDPRFGVTKEAKPVVKNYQGPFELTAQGTIAMQDNDYSIHLHAVVGGQEHNLVAMGHFVSGKITILTEVVITEVADYEMVRVKDDNIFCKPVLFFK